MQSRQRTALGSAVRVPDPVSDTQEQPPGPPNTARPKYGSLPTWLALSGLGRSKTYEMLGNGTLRAVKVGKRLLIDVEHGLATLDAMPAAEIRVGRRRKAASNSFAA